MQKNQKSKPVKPAPKVLAPALSSDAYLKGKSLYLYLGLAVLLVLIIFWDYITFKNLYLYKDIGSDTIAYSWPHWAHLSEYMHKYGMPKWSFNQGMGQNIYAFSIGDPFSLFLCLLNKDSIPYAIVFMEMLKIVGGGLFIYLYLRMLDTTHLAAVTGGLLYAFGGYMILGSGWYVISTEAFYATIILYSGERFLRHGTWYLLPIAFCLLAVLQPFYIYLYGLLLAVYSITRTIVFSPKWQWKDLILPLFKMGGLAVCGILLGSFAFFSNAWQLFNNPRVSGGASTFKLLSSQPVFGLTPRVEIASAIYRMFSNDLTGAGSNFKGSGNYLEAPLLYIGLISLLLVPQAFLFFSKRERKVYGILLGFCLVPMVFCYFRFMFWLFAGDFFRSYTLFLSMLMLFLAIKALTFIDRTGIVHIKTLLGTLVVLLLLLFHNFFEDVPNAINANLRNIIAVFLLAYTGLIYLLGKRDLKLYGLIGLGFCLFIELASFSNTTVNNRVVMHASDLKEKKGYNDYTVEAVNYVKSKDASFYRIFSGYTPDAAQYVCLNGPQMNNYYGLTDYAEWNQANYVNFLREMKVSNYADSTYSKWLFGPFDRVLLKSLFSVKYAFSKQRSYNGAASGYDSLAMFGNVKVFKNKYALPFGFTYNKFIPLDEFRKSEIDQMMMNAFVADSSEIGAFSGMQQLTSQTHFPPISFDTYQAYVTALKKDTLAISSFDQNNISGKIKVDEKKLLFLSIPYDKGWLATVDGKEVKTYKVNIGFTGILLDKGEHSVELHYHVPLFAAGIATSAICILLYAFAFIKYRKRSF